MHKADILNTVRGIGAGLAAICLALSGRAASPQESGTSLWDLARSKSDVHRFSTLFTAQDVRGSLGTQPGLEQAIQWCKQTGVTKVYLEVFRDGYRAELDRRKLGLGVLAFVRVDAERSAGEATRELEDAICRLPEVISCHYISGAGTFELQVIVTDLEAFSQFSIKTLLNLPNVKDIHTSFSLGEVKSGAALPLSHL